VLSIEAPEIPANFVTEELPGRLLDLLTDVFSYVLSFGVILIYWMSHHVMFRSIRAYDRRLIWLNS
jgi:uncharacterized membrane protein